MTRPGVEISSRAAPPSRATAINTGTLFMAAPSLRGQTGVPLLIRNMSEFVDLLGPRQTNSFAYDAADVFFREGGSRIYFSRIVGPAAAKDTVTLDDSGSADSIRVDSLGPGATDLSVAVVAGTGGGTFVIVIYDNGVEIERSYDLADVAAAVAWASTNEYIRITALGSNDPAVVAAQPLASGTDDYASITDTHRVAALAVFDMDLGTGQVSIPGATTTAAHVGILNHAHAFNRVAVLDATNTASRSTIVAQADAILAHADLVDGAEGRGALFAPWDVVPGVVRGTTRTVPPSARVAGLMARSDSISGNPNVPAAGVNGIANYVLSLSQSPWASADREALNVAGVNISRVVQESVRLYGYRTLAPVGDPWDALNAARIRGVIEHDANRIGEQFMFAQIDGKGHKIAEFAGTLTGMLQKYYTLGALYGETPDEAFVVDVGPSVNTPVTIANRELRAVIGIRTSPFAEFVYIEIVKVPITESL